MKRIIIISVFLLIGIMSKAQVNAWINDNNPPTNIRSAANGKVVMSLPDTCSYMIGLTSPKNGWWRVEWIEAAEEATEIELKGSSSGTYWIHNSVVACSTRNYGNARYCLRDKPSKKGKATYWFTDEQLVHPVSFNGYWVEVVLDGHKGWIENEMLCDNPLTTCP